MVLFLRRNWLAINLYVKSVFKVIKQITHASTVFAIIS